MEDPIPYGGRMWPSRGNTTVGNSSDYLASVIVTSLVGLFLSLALIVVSVILCGLKCCKSCSESSCCHCCACCVSCFAPKRKKFSPRAKTAISVVLAGLAALAAGALIAVLVGITRVSDGVSSVFSFVDTYLAQAVNLEQNLFASITNGTTPNVFFALNGVQYGNETFALGSFDFRSANLTGIVNGLVKVRDGFCSLRQISTPLNLVISFVLIIAFSLALSASAVVFVGIVRKLRPVMLSGGYIFLASMIMAAIVFGIGLPSSIAVDDTCYTLNLTQARFAGNTSIIGSLLPPEFAQCIDSASLANSTSALINATEFVENVYFNDAMDAVNSVLEQAAFDPLPQVSQFFSSFPGWSNSELLNYTAQVSMPPALEFSLPVQLSLSSNATLVQTVQWQALQSVSNLLQVTQFIMKQLAYIGDCNVGALNLILQSTLRNCSEFLSGFEIAVYSLIAIFILFFMFMFVLLFGHAAIDQVFFPPIFNVIVCFYAIAAALSLTGNIVLGLNGERLGREALLPLSIIITIFLWATFILASISQRLMLQHVSFRVFWGLMGGLTFVITGLLIATFSLSMIDVVNCQVNPCATECSSGYVNLVSAVAIVSGIAIIFLGIVVALIIAIWFRPELIPEEGGETNDSEKDEEMNTMAL